MKRVFWFLVLAISLTGCTNVDRSMEEAMQLRERVLSGTCSFQTRITADYGDSLYTFSMVCSSDRTGGIQFEISEPDTISGITGTISDAGGNLTFDDEALFFPLLTEDLLVPASAPWILMKTLRGGYITAVSEEESFLHMTVHDSFSDDALMLDIWLNEDRMPVRGDILHEGKRILSLEIENFRIA